MSKIIPLRRLASTSSLPDDIATAVEAAVRDFRTLLVESASQAVATPADLLRFEAALHARVPGECLDPVTGAVIVHALEEQEVALRAEALVASRQGQRLQKQGQRVEVALRGGGTVPVRTAYFLDRRPRRGPKRRRGQRGRTGHGTYPLLEALGIHGRVTPALASEVARLVVTHSEEAAQEELRRHGVRRDKKAIRRIVQVVAGRALANREASVSRAARPPGVGPLSGKRVGIFVDGGRLRVRLKKRGRRRRNGGKSFQADWKEPKVLVICELDERGRKVRGGFLRYEATLGDADDLFRILGSLLCELGALDADLWVVGGDGAKWIWNRYSKLATDLGYDPEKVVEVVDFWHAVGYLWEFAGLCGKWTDSQRRRWVHVQKRGLRAGRVDDVVAEMRSYCLGRNAKKLKILMTRFAANRDRMRYDQFKLQGIPRGSGAVESAVRRIVNLRLKGCGIFWLPENAEGLLHLRAQLLCGRWDDLMRRILEPAPFWRRHPARGPENLAA